MKQFISKTIYLLITLMFMGVFAMPGQVKADWTDIFGGSTNGSYGSYGTYGGYPIGGILGSRGSSYGSYGSYGYSDPYSSTSGYNDGNIKINKKVRRIGQDDNYHESALVRSGAIVEVLIEVKNNSKNPAPVVVTDEMGYSSVYKTGTYRLTGATSASGDLTSGGLYITIPAKGTATIIYQVYVCGGSYSSLRAYAYSAGVGSASDAVIIQTQDSQFTYSYANNTSTCLNQVQAVYTNNNNNTNYTSSNPFAGWTGVNNSGTTNSATTTTVTTNSNPFGDWTGVNNMGSTTVTPAPVNTNNNPFGDWSGVNNMGVTTVTPTPQSNSNNNPFGDWTGVNNLSNTSANNPFAGWSGVNNSSSASNPFQDWSGVNNSTTTSNPFSDWSGVSTSASNYDASGYQASYANYSAETTNPTRTAATTPTYVAPKTGVDKTAPLVFAGFITLIFLAIKKRKLIFN